MRHTPMFFITVYNLCQIVYPRVSRVFLIHGTTDATKLMDYNLLLDYYS